MLRRMFFIVYIFLMVNFLVASQPTPLECQECVGQIRTSSDGTIYSLVDSSLYVFPSDNTAPQIYDLTTIHPDKGGIRDFVALADNKLLFFDYHSQDAPLTLIDINTQTTTPINSPISLISCDLNTNFVERWYAIRRIGSDSVVVCSIENGFEYINIGHILDNQLVIDNSFQFGKNSNINLSWLDIAASNRNQLLVMAKPNDFSQAIVPNYDINSADEYKILRFDIGTGVWDYTRLDISPAIVNDSTWVIPEIAGVDSAGNIYMFFSWSENSNDTFIFHSNLAKYDENGTKHWEVTENDFTGTFSRPVVIDNNRITFVINDTEFVTYTCDFTACVPAPKLSPVLDSSNSYPSLTWSVVDEADSYLLSINSAETTIQEVFNSLDICNANTCSAILSQPLEVDIYSATVQASNATVTSEWSNSETFSILQHCDTTIVSGDVTGLISAIDSANGTPEADTICLEAGTYTLTGVNNSSNGPNGWPQITTDITLVGLDAGATLYRDANADAFRHFLVGGTGHLTLYNVVLVGIDISDEN